jgi:ATP-dependent exoDNAse (exonuclease V) beta subunit
MYPPLDEATLTLEQVRDRLSVFADPRFRFDAGPHAYWLGKRRLTSATSLVGKYHKPFNAALQAPRTAAKRGVSVAEILAEWRYAAVMGSATHDYLEHEYPLWYAGAHNVLHVPYPEDAEVTHRIRKFQRLRELRLLDLEPIGQEIRMFWTPPGWEEDEEAKGGLSGTLDLLCWHHPTQRLYVADYKTSKVINTDADPHYEMFYAPFQDLKVNQLNEYSLQTSVYRMFLASIGIPTAGAFIIHLPPHAEPAQIIKCRDFTERLRFIFS